MSEHGEQAAFVDYVLYTYRTRVDFIRMLFFAVPNGAWIGGSNPHARASHVEKLKREGFLPGVADLLYLQPRGGYAYLAIEMKMLSRRGEKNGGLTEEQSAFLQAATRAGAMAVVCYSADEAIYAFDNYMEYMIFSSTGENVIGLRDLLLMVGEDVSTERIAAWTPKQRTRAEAWAAKVYLVARDNQVRVPRRPSFLNGIESR